MTHIARVLALVLAILFACTAGLIACAPANEAVLASTPEPTITATAMSFSPSPALTPSPVATSTPIDLEEKARLGISHENQIVPF